MNKILNPIAKYFNFEGRSTTFKKELIGGMATFMAMAYILAVNPAMLKQANGASNYAGVFFLGTAVSAFVATMAMGIFAKVPLALAPGMGVNAFFTYTVASRILGLQIEDALVATFFSGILYAIIALTPARIYIAKLLPKNFKLGIGAMIGLFLAYLGLTDSGIIVSDAFSGPISIPHPTTADPSQFAWKTIPGTGDMHNVLQQATYTASSTNTKFGSFKDPYVIIAVVTMLLVFSLHFMKVSGAALIAMVAAIIMLAIAFGCGVQDSETIFKIQHYDGFGKFGELSSKMWTSVGSALSNGKIYIAIFVFLYMDFFDTTGTLFAIDGQAKFSETDPKWMGKANIVDAGGTIFGSLMLTSTVTTYVESTVGVSQGARTGFSSVVTGALFGLSIAAWPLLSCVMPIAHQQAAAAAHSTIQPVTGPILILVGALMISQLKHFEWAQAIDIPVLFVTLVFGMLGYSISGGIAFGVVTYYVLNSAALLMSTIKTKRGKTFEINDDEIPAASGVGKIKVKNPDFKKRVLNPVMITMFVLSLVYICTMPLYAF